MLVESEKTALIRDAAANGTLPSNADIADWIISYRQSGNAMFQRNKSTISRHIRNVFESGELNPDSTVAFFATVQNEGNRKVERNIAYYNLDVIISVGYRVNSHRGVQFRIWATQILREYLVKGFAMNDDLLKRAGGGNYFDELLARIRDIRSSEKVFYRKILEIYALSIDYDPRAEATQKFFKTVQNKIHFSVHGHTAAEVIYNRADAEKDFMGLTSWTGALPKRTDAAIAKNYLPHSPTRICSSWQNTSHPNTGLNLKNLSMS